MHFCAYLKKGTFMVSLSYLNLEVICRVEVRGNQVDEYNTLV